MAQEQRYKRDAAGQRLGMTGISTVLPPDALNGKYPFLQNVRAYSQGRMTSRATQAGAVETLAAAVHSLRRLNDTTPAGPGSGFSLIGGAAGRLYNNSTQVASGLSGNPLALVPFRPNTSPQPWMYVADSSLAATTTASGFACAGMLKVRSDGLTYKMGVMEPQNAPVVTSANAVVSGNVTVPSTTRPWNQTGTNPVNYPFTSTGGTNPVVIACAAGATIQLVLSVPSQTIVTSYGTHTAGDFGPVGAGSPGFNVPGSFCNVLMGAFVDGSGNVLTPSPGQGPWTVGNGPTTLLAPTGAVSFQLGIDDTAYGSGSGNFTVAYTVTTQAVTNVVSILGNVTAYFWGDSPNSGPVASYIWQNPTDPTGTGTPRSVGTAVGTAQGTSLTFDYFTGGGNPGQPMEWATLDSAGNITAQFPVFATPPPPTTTFADFNMCLVGQLYFPAAGTYSLTLNSKDGCLWGIGGAATWAGKGTLRGYSNQSMTVASKLALLPNVPLFGGAEAEPNAVTVAVTVPAAGDYPIELDYDYWFHTPRGLWLTCAQNTGVANNFLPPLNAALLTKTKYRYTYRSSVTGATSNPSPESAQNSDPVQVSTVTPDFSLDPQVDKVDYYRMDSALDNFTYVGTGPNTNPATAFKDILLDADVVGNPALEFDNYEPFPSIDLPKAGIVNVIAGVAHWVSGNQFNKRWLGGTIINIGGIAYTLMNRPQSVTTLTPVNALGQAAADGTGLIYEIAEPILAAQPCPSMWGNTDNAAYAFAIDPLNPGDLLWCKGNNLDSAPQGNRQPVTSASEPLVNGVVENGLGMVFSADNGWLIYPAFQQALATVNGVQGNPFSLIRSGVTRGLYIRPAICTDGSGMFFYRSKDGIEVCSGTSEQKSITDDDLYNLFPHEGFVPQPITLAGFTLYPPDDSQPEKQKLRFATGYLYYDYLDTGNNPRTLVYDVAGKGWVRDVYQFPATIHMLEEGPNVNGVLVGCSDGSVRPLVANGGETGLCVVLTPAVNGGDTRAEKTVGDIFVRASVATSTVAVAPYANQYATALAGFSPAALPVGAGLTPYILDFVNGLARDVPDIEMAFSWAIGTATFLDVWQPDWTELPESTQDRPSDWTDGGMSGDGFWQGLTLEADSFNQPKAIVVQSQDGALHTPDQSPVTWNGQSKRTLTFTPPFTSHMVRILSTDGVPWRYWGAAWTVLPFPPSVVQWQSEMTSLNGRGWQHIREFNIEHISTADLTLTLVFDKGAVPATMTLTVPHSGGLQAKTKITARVNKFKLASFRLSSSAPFRHWQEGMECKVGIWGREESYRVLKPFGGESAEGATL